jgi:hypothetical protein
VAESSVSGGSSTFSIERRTAVCVSAPRILILTC